MQANECGNYCVLQQAQTKTIRGTHLVANRMRSIIRLQAKSQTKFWVAIRKYRYLHNAIGKAYLECNISKYMCVKFNTCVK